MTLPHHSMIRRKLQQPITKIDWVYAASLTILAAIPRLCCLNLAEFKLDEASHYQMAYFLTRGQWRWVGSTSSVGFPKPPLFVYALALPMQLSHDPRIVTAFLGILAALATGGFYLILRQLLAKSAASSAALLFALNPQAILYARKLFTADLIPPLCTLFLGTALAFLQSPPKRAGRFAMLTALTFALLLLNTFSPALLLPAILVLFWQRRRDLKTRDYLGAIAAFVAPFVPYLLQVAPLIPNIINSSSSSASHPPLLKWIWTLLYGAPWPSNQSSIASIPAIILGLFTLLGIAWLVHAARKQDSRAWAIFFLAWLGLAPLMALLVPVKVEAHYLIVLYPLLFVLPAASVELAQQKANWLAWSAMALLIITTGWQVHIWTDNLKAVARGVQGYGTPLGYWWRAVEQARDLLGEHEAAEVLLLMPGDQPWDEKAHILDALLSDAPHRVINGYLSMLYPQHKAVLLTASEVEDAMEFITPCSQEIGHPLQASPFGETYYYYLWDPATSAAPDRILGLEPVSVQWASGTQLLGFSAAGSAQPGATIRVILYWETKRGPLCKDVHWFNHLLDQEEHKWGQFDTAGWPAGRWQPRERVVTYFNITIDPQAEAGPYILRVGQYIYPSLEKVPIVDEMGNAADFIDLPLHLPYN